MRLIASLLIVALIFASAPVRAADNCLSDEELRTLVRSVYTRSIGKVLHICGDAYPKLDGLALRAANDFFNAYAQDMQENRLQANAIMMRFAGNEWQEELDGFLTQATQGDEMWAHLASDSDCQHEIVRVGRAATDRNYTAAMNAPRAVEQYNAERPRVPACEALKPAASDAKE